MYVNRPLVVSTVVVLASLAASASATAEPTKQECLQANESAQELRRSGKLRDARARLAVCIVASCPGPVRDDCTERLNEVEKAQPTVVFEAKNAAGDDLSAVKVSIDGAPFADRLNGTALNVDPGEHAFRFQADGLPTVEKKFVIREGEKGRREQIVLVGTIAAPRSTLAPVDGTLPVDAAPSDGSTQRTVGLLLGGVGIVGVAIGSIFGLKSRSTYVDAASSTNCPHGPTTCNQVGIAGGRDAHDQATISTIGFVAGGVLAAGGMLLYFTAPNSRDVAVAPTVGSNSASLSIRGSW